MKSIDAQFGLQDHLAELYAARPGRLAFCAESLADFERWQQALRLAARQLLGLDDRMPRSLTVTQLDTIEHVKYIEGKL